MGITNRLTPKEETFCQVLVAKGAKASQTQAYRQAYEPNCELAARTITTRASMVARKPHVAARITELRNQFGRTHQVTAHRTLQALDTNIHFDVRKLFNSDGSVKAPAQLDDETAMGIKEIKMREVELGGVMTRTYTYKSHDKNAAISHAMEYLGMKGPRALPILPDAQVDPLSRLSGDALYKRVTEIIQIKASGDTEAGRIFDADQAIIAKHAKKAE